MSIEALAFSALVFFIGSLIKGVVGFALPLIAMAGLSLFLPAKEAIAIMLIPLFMANLLQAIEAGPRKALQTASRFSPMVLVLAVVIFFVASSVIHINDQVLYLCIGVAVVLASGVQLLGWRPVIPLHRERIGSIVAGFCGGVMGGLAGAFGPPVVLYLTGLGVERSEQVRAQGLTYFVGSIMLLIAHSRTGLFTLSLAPVSLAMIIPAVLGLRAGQHLRGRLDEGAFRKAVLVTLFVMGLNMLRKGLTG